MANSEPRGPSSVQANRWPRPDYCQLLSAAGPFDLMANCFERCAVNRNLLVVDRPRPVPPPNDAGIPVHVYAFCLRLAPLLTRLDRSCDRCYKRSCLSCILIPGRIGRAWNSWDKLRGDRYSRKKLDTVRCGVVFLFVFFLFVRNVNVPDCGGKISRVNGDNWETNIEGMVSRSNDSVLCIS